MNKLIKEICKREGKKSQVSVGNVREILKILTDILAEELCFVPAKPLGDQLYKRVVKKAKLVADKSRKK